jgi:hypothetical protein
MHSSLNFLSKKYIFGLVLIAILWSNLPASAQDIAEKNVPPEVQKVFSLKYPDHSEAYWTLKDGLYGVSFKTAKGYLDAWFSPKGKWAHTEKIIEFEALPKVVIDSLNASHFGDWDVGNVYVMEIPGKATRYKLYVYSSNWDELELVFEANGRLIPDLP